MTSGYNEVVMVHVEEEVASYIITTRTQYLLKCITDLLIASTSHACRRRPNEVIREDD